MNALICIFSAAPDTIINVAALSSAANLGGVRYSTTEPQRCSDDGDYL